MARLAGPGRAFVRCRSGIASVEFVIVLFPMILFLFGIIGFGLVTYTHNNMVNAAREAVRRLAVAEDAVVAANTATTSQPPVECGSAQLQTLIDAATASGKTAAEEIACDYVQDWQITFNVQAFECVTGRDVRVVLTTSASDAFVVDLFDFFEGNLTADVTMRREEACA
ncbi:MAG: pilus assembly protein [Gammaproteobacteria bacterium]|nr:pilus assembly protein [Gammaproteobacteria bacterium]NIX85818.1 hypothetical protein [Gammaproteobacteria bacterium]